MVRAEDLHQVLTSHHAALRALTNLPAAVVGSDKSTMLCNMHTAVQAPLLLLFQSFSPAFEMERALPHRFLDYIERTYNNKHGQEKRELT
ncbi:hypothetical protein [Paenibacillus sp. NPDC057934]|uniref:hypothetical protein n=1 Tax=Paenibacillus sp. NPDC057934 TaxID=3346282 RepID=UPI0036DF1ED0